MLLPWYNNWNKDKGSRNKEMIRLWSNFITVELNPEIPIIQAIKFTK